MIVEAFRSLRAAPGVTAFILCILTLTISTATVTFSVVDAVVLRPLPFDRPDELVSIEHYRGDRVMSQARAMSAVQFLALRERTEAFAVLAAVTRGWLMLEGGAEPERVSAARVTASLFDVLRVQAFIGETFGQTREIAGTERVAVISYALWRRRFGADPDIVGRTLKAREPQGEPDSPADGTWLVLGVMPEGFSYPLVDDRLTAIWTPYVIPKAERLGAEQSSYLHIVGRLREGSSVAQAQIQADEVRKTLVAAERVHYYSPSGRFTVTRLDEAVAGPVRGWMLLVLLAVGLLLVLACANVANLLLTRAINRARELSIRTALGATRRRLFGSLLVESVMLSVSAVAMALLVSVWGIGAARASLPPGIARAHTIALDPRVFGAAVAAAIFTGLLFGMIPAFQASRGDLAAVLRSGAATIAGAGSRWRTLVLVSEMAFASVLLVATTLFVSSFVRLTRADLGFDRANLLLLDPVAGLEGSVHDFVNQLQAVPGVTAVGGAAAGSPPLVMSGFGGGASGTRLQPADAAPGSEFVAAEFNRVSSGYFSAAAIPIMRGRVFDDAEPAMSGAVVLDELAARQLFADRDPIGREVFNGRTRSTVIGVVANVRMRGPEAPSGPQAYFPGPSTARSYAFLVRTSQPPARVMPEIQAAIATLREPRGQPVLIRPIEDAFRNITARRRFSAGTMVIFGVLALFIGAVGVYGVMASVVAQRSREIGVRMALGATRQQIVSAVLGQASRVIVAGLAVGLPAAWLVTRGFGALFFEVRPTDGWVYAIAGGALAGVALVAALVPARRASRVDPLAALRAE
jgi:predicted permease